MMAERGASKQASKLSPLRAFPRGGGKSKEEVRDLHASSHATYGACFGDTLNVAELY